MRRERRRVERQETSSRDCRSLDPSSYWHGYGSKPTHMLPSPALVCLYIEFIGDGDGDGGGDGDRADGDGITYLGIDQK